MKKKNILMVVFGVMMILIYSIKVEASTNKYSFIPGMTYSSDSENGLHANFIFGEKDGIKSIEMVGFKCTDSGQLIDKFNRHEFFVEDEDIENLYLNENFSLVYHNGIFTVREYKVDVVEDEFSATFIKQ